MARMLYSVTMSLDGFIAGPGGDMSWLTPYLGPNPTAEAVRDQVGALLVGARTWGGDDPNRGDEDKEGAFSGQWHGPQVVLTHRTPEEDIPGVTFVDDLDGAVAMAKEVVDGDGYVNILGAEVARQCLQAGVVDEILTFIVPVLLGDGTRLFAHPGGSEVRLERLSVGHTDVETHAWFRVLS